MKTKNNSVNSTNKNGDALHKVKQKGIIKAKDSLSGTKVNSATSLDDIVDLDSTVEIRHKYIGRATQIHYPTQPLYISRGVGQYLYDENDKQYLDLMNNVAHVGHCHPEVVKASQDQMAILNTNSRFLHDKILKCAKKLTSLLPEKLNVCFFVNSGTEANDLAMRLAKTYTKHKDVVVLDHAYHGHSVAVIDISPYKFRPLKEDGQQDYIHVAPQPDCYRGERVGDVDDVTIGEAYADDAIKIMDEAVAKGRKIGMFIAESMISCGGQMLIPKGYLKKVYSHVRKLGGVCVADEVQVGFGRSGKNGYWGFDRHEVVPDMVTIGKPFGNGHPVSAVITTEEIAVAMEKTGVAYFNTNLWITMNIIGLTFVLYYLKLSDGNGFWRNCLSLPCLQGLVRMGFGGNPVSMVTALTVMEIIEKENLQQNAEEVGEYCKLLLNQQKAKHKIIGDVRGCGLFIGIDLVNDLVTKEEATEKAAEICLKLRERGILISRDGPANNVLKVKPPMVITKDDMKNFVDQLDAVLTEVEALDAGDASGPSNNGH